MTTTGNRGVGAVILAGGKSERMGMSKAKLLWRDGKTFLEHMTDRLRHLDEVLVSVSAPEQDGVQGCPVIVDRCPGRGPMGGIHSALLACRSEWLLVVSCDMPLFERELADYLISKISDKYDIVSAVTRDGEIHPLCGVYSKRAADILDGLMASGNYRMRNALRRARFLPVNLEGTPCPDEMLANVNTPGEYAALFSNPTRHPPVVAVSGVKNSGKTTLLAEIIPILDRQGLRVAVIKHDGHDFVPDVPGTDSFRLRTAGAAGTAVYSASRYMIVREAEGITVDRIARQFSDVDLILLEGGKSSGYPKIEIVRSEVSRGSFASDPRSLLALCTDEDLHAEGVPVFSLTDYEGVAGRIAEFVRAQTSR
ncbi:MAG: molybdopterin-guanine dinucleotide biosynthesis protein B [Synergistaceae bacterium]|jgi:molybdopterin-guanine dinucleotide biosynthesis protein MobB|nr:molybdopterin-guanine dinucleotide biosynthesis protein B [Synergistaceae bacterium]